MALTQSCQLYPTNFTLFMATFPRFHVNKVHLLLNAGSSISFKKQFFCAIRDTESSNSIPTNNPQKRSNLYPKNKKNEWDPTDSDPSKSGLVASRDSWLDNWNDTRKPNSGSGKRVVDYRNRGEFSDSDTEQGTSASTGGSTMERIVEKLKKFGYMDEVSDRDENVGKGIEKGSIEDIFYVEEGLLPNARGGFSEDFPFGDGNRVGRGNREVRFPWEKNVSDEQKQSVDSRRSRSLAELTLPESELRRLKNLALRIKNKMRITGAGVTQQVVETIREKWRTSEVVRLKIEGPSALNMKRMHEILERKTGGLVIWRSGTSISLYRGATYEDPVLKFKKGVFRRNEIPDKSSSLIDKAGQDSSEHVSLSKTNASQEESVIINPDYRNTETSSENIYEDEINRLLDSLGPRYEDWPGDGPLPVDADLLPGVIPGYQSPFRLLPYGVRSTVGMKEATALRRLARVIPPHFALGRSRQHQGLAAAMIKLWERSSIAKIALKRGVQLTTSERMAEDLKRLTGGMLLSRNKDFLVFYRGKNFLTPEVAEALLEKERQAKDMQDEEERARLRTFPLVTPSFIESDESGTGTLKETLEANTKWGKRLDNDHKEKVMREAEVLRHANLVRKLEKKLAFAERKLTKAERALSKVEESLNPADHTEDPESLTDEERFMFRKLGLRMKAFLLLGRRGIFGGTVENMHLHWKYRELVKIIVKAQNIEEVKNIALSLEAESGGVLVSVDKVSKGYAVVVFRGRDYKRPSALRPKNLLTKRKALARSIELQRREALLSHMSTLDARVRKLRSEIEKMATVEDNGDEELYNKLDSAYLSEDEESEEEDDSNDLEMYDSENDIVDTNDDSVSETFLETSFPYEYEDESDTEFAESK